MSGWAGQSEEEKSPATPVRTDCEDAQWVVDNLNIDFKIVSMFAGRRNSLGERGACTTPRA
jgi:hypothetical protein